MKTLITSIKRLALALCFVTPLVSWAAEMTNPVTGETETYENVFAGTGETETEWNSTDNWDTSTTPFITTTYSPALVTNKTVSTTAAIDGYTLRVGAYNGAAITWNGGISKIQSASHGCWLTADETSSITIASFGGNQLEGSSTYPLKLSSAKAGGITWSAGLTNAGNTTLPFWYYLKGDGTVVYEGDITVANAQVIKMADVTLSGNDKSVQSKTLVTFGEGTTAAFTAAAVIKVKNDQDAVVREVVLSSIVDGDTTLTTDNKVGDCQFVKTATGIDLYFVDGDCAEFAVTQPSVNINFTHNGVNVTSYDEVGALGYSVSGYYWNNIAGGAGETTTVYGKTATGAKAVIDGMSFVVSDTRGSYRNTNAGNILNGYIDDLNDAEQSPTVEVSGIPEDYANYRVILYFSGDTAGNKFGYVTINDENYWGTEAWGSVNATAFVEGGNYRVSPIISRGDGTLTIVTHCMSGARAGLAAIQIVKVELGANDLVIPVNGATEYPVEAAQTPGTVYLTGVGTLTLAGDYKISASTLDIDAGVVLNVDSSKLDAVTFTGAGTVVYDGAVPPTDKGWTDSAWTGTVWLKNKSGITGNNNADTGVRPNSLGNANSKVKFSGVSGWLEAPVTYNPEIVLENADYDYALQLTDGNSPASNNNNGNRCTVIKNLSGDGTLGCGGNSYAWPLLQVWDATRFTGSINTSNASGNGQGKTGLVVVFCAENTEFSDTLYALFKGEGSYPHPHTIYVASGTTVTQGSGATWTSESFGVDGTLVANGTLASSASTAVSGAGTVVFTGRAPTVSGDAWWKNAAWTGTVTVKSVTNLIGESGSGTYIDFNEYGNGGSTFELNGCAGWLPGPYECTVPLKVTGTLNLNNGLSDRDHIFTINHLKGNGTIYGGSTADKVIIRVKEWSEFTGLIQLDKKIVVFGEDEMPVKADLTAGQIIVSAGAVVTNVNNTANGWWATGGIKVNGELCSQNLTRFGGGTTITTGDSGVFTLLTDSDTDDLNTNYARIRGTGTLKFEGSAYRTISTNNFPTALVVENNLASGLIHKLPGVEVTIGSLAGTGKIRSDWSNGNRNLKVLQSSDTTFSGVFDAGIDRLGTFTVAPGASSAGTLTLSGAQTASNELVIDEGGSVNLTGTWKGATTVAGAFGGTGTLTGNLTFAEGSTFKVWESDINGLAVSGTITYPENGTVTVDVSDIETTGGDLVILTASDANVTVDANKFALADGTGEGYSLSVNDAGNLVLTAPAAVGAIAPTDNPLAYTIYQTTEQVIAALAGLSGSQTLTVTGTFAVDSVTVQSGLDLTVNIMGGSISVGTFNVAGSLILSRDTVSSTSVVLTDAAASCRVYSTLVESVSVTSGVEGKVPSKNEDTSPLYTLVDDTYNVTGSETLDSTGSFTVPAGTTKIKIGTYDVTLGFSIVGTTATLIAPEVVEETNKKAIDVGTTDVTLNVELVPGLYYGVASGTGLTLTRPAALTQCTGSNNADILTVTKPSDAKGFFKVFVDIK